MNALGMFLLGAAVRGAGLVAIAGVVGWAFRRKGPAASAWLGLATLVGMVGVAVLGASPWPRWEIVGAGGMAGPAAVPAVAAPAGTVEAAAEAPEAPAALDVKPPDEGLAAAVRSLGVALMRPAAAPERAGWGWPGWIAAVAIVGIVIGLGRFALGLAAVAALRRSSHPVDDPDLLELASVLRQRLGVGPRVELRVAPGLAMPATIGWRRPLILLPADWPGWDERERRVVLAHELRTSEETIIWRASGPSSAWRCSSTTRWRTGSRCGSGSTRSWRPTRGGPRSRAGIGPTWRRLPGWPSATSRDRSVGPPGRSLRPVALS